MNTTKLFLSLNGIAFRGFPNVRWDFIFGRLSLYFQCKEFDKKAKVISLLDSFTLCFFQKLLAIILKKKEKSIALVCRSLSASERLTLRCAGWLPSTISLLTGAGWSLRIPV